jgi:hypothetical protein
MGERRWQILTAENDMVPPSSSVTVDFSRRTLSGNGGDSHRVRCAIGNRNTYAFPRDETLVYTS